VALVGHTDAQGTLDNNIALSKKRATSVLNRLVEKHGVDANQLTAEGMGYLSPIASNLSAEGREANRRVEAVLLNTK
jgi:OOP family OmpA-OmpF porin